MASLHKFNCVTQGPSGETTWETTSVVTSDEEFDEFIELIRQQFLSQQGKEARTGQPMTEQTLTQLHELRSVPLMMRGTKTEPLFVHFGVTTQYMSVIVRGEGENVFRKSLSDLDKRKNEKSN